MVPACSTDDKEISITFKVRDVNRSGEDSVQHVAIGLSEKVQELFKTVAELYNYEPTSFELILQNLKTGGTYILNEYKYHPLTDLGHFLNFDLPNNVTLTPRKKRRAATTTRSRDFYTTAAAAGVTTVDSLRAPPPPPVATGGGGVVKTRVTTTTATAESSSATSSATATAVWSGSSSSSCSNTVESEEERYKSMTSTSMSTSTATTTGSMKLYFRPPVGGGGGGGESSNNGGGQSGNNDGGGQSSGNGGNNVEDDLSLGASASPTTGGQDTEEEEEEDGRGDVGVAGGGGGGTGEANGREKRRVYDDRGDINTFKDLERNSRFLGGHVKFFEFDDPTTSLTEEEDTKHHVGLVNQAMTCYLNSLLQALFNTPEFRNALYNWEFDGSSPDNSIPFQLQKLFVNLQTSPRTAVETTDLTHSFGWGMQAAWEQHDIQELCRVMFDALEQKFKDTRQANLINDLYEGKMLDYVRCVECGTDKSREDTFLDIPLPVRPFGSTVAYTSVEEALRAFVQPETLDGANQYHCDSCNKKCDAHKGLKFIKLPYLLTLHLKRFDFDYSTMHRVKLNDKVVFPEKLNLNSFVTNTSIPSTLPDEILEDRDAGSVKCDDCSTTDYGSALDDESCQGTDASSFINCPFENYQDDDEGIDVSSGNNLNENEKNRRQEPQGPYFYELFSIMIHSGSASGGHYYAYIKDFENHNWYCYNDTNVARITEEDVQKTYGGGPQRGYYSGAYTSSTNAYMLMYRQINADRNASAMTVEQFPPHITSLLNHIRNAEESKRLAKEQENYMRQMKVYCYHPVKDQLVSMKHFVVSSDPLAVITEQTRAKLELESVVALEDCRLVHYNRAQDWIETSFENPGEIKFESVARESKESWLFEIKQPGNEWTNYDHTTVNLRTYLLNLDTFDIDSQLVIRVPYNCCLAVLRKHVLPALAAANVGQRFTNGTQQLHFVLKSADESFQYLLEDIVYFTAGRSVNKLFLAVTTTATTTGCKEGSVEWFEGSRLRELVQRCECLVEFNVVFPDTDINILNALTIPSLDLNQNFDRIMDMSAVDNNRPVSPNLRVSPQPGGSSCGAVPPSVLGDGFGDHSNSEDSSLSDSDRTLVGDAPDLHLSSPVDPPDIFNKTHQEVNMNMNWDEPTTDSGSKPHSYYFKAHRIDSTASQQPHSTVSTAQTQHLHTLRVLADQRMLLPAFKENLSPHIGVPVDYFKLYRLTGNKEIEWSFRLELIDGSTSTSGGNTVTSTEACDSILVKLERNLRDCEYAVTIYEFRSRPAEGEEVYRILFDWIIGAGQLVSTVKKDILQHAQKHHMLDIPYNRARLRKKNNKNPSTIYLDDQTFVEQISIRGSAEIFLETLTQDETMQGNQFSLYLRHWQPSTLTLSPPVEFTVEKPTTLLSLQQLAASFMLATTTSSNLLPATTTTSSTTSEKDTTTNSSSSSSGEEEVPIEEVEVAVVRAAYPGDGVSLLQMNLAWNGTELTHNQARLDERYEDGTVFFCRDRREPIKELSASEREEFLTKENLRLDNVGGGASSSANTTQSFSNDNNTTTYTRRRERALKIYLDTSPPPSKEPESMAID